MTIAMNETPNLRVNIFTMEFDASAASGALPETPSVALIFGQRTAAGTAAAGARVRVTAPGQAAELFGAGAQAALMVRSYFANNQTTECFVIPLDDNPAGAAAQGSITVSASTPDSGTVFLYIGGQRLTVGVNPADTSASLAAAIVAVINAAPALPVTAAVNGTNPDTVDLTAKNKGEAGNDISVLANLNAGEAFPGGVDLLSPGRISGGTGNPDLTAAIAAMGDDVYTDIACPFNDAVNLALLKTEMERRWAPVAGSVVYGGTAYAVANLSLAGLSAFGATHNSQHLSVLGLEGSPTPHWQAAAALCGAISREAAIDPARPFQTVPLRGILPPVPEDRFEWNERNLLLYDGISTVTFDADGTCRIERIITTYRQNAAGEDDISYLDLNTVKTLLYYRFSLLSRFRKKFPRHKLANDRDRFSPGQPIMTPGLARAEIISHYMDVVWNGLFENLETFKKSLLIERDAANPSRLLGLVSPDVINQFRQLAVRNQFRL